MSLLYANSNADTPASDQDKSGMAIYLLKHSSVGKSTHAARAAGAHIRYITRPNAHADIIAMRMPEDRLAARRWFDQQEKTLRKNGRVADKLITALPLELHPLQRRKLVMDFCEEIAKMKAPWFAAIHQTGEDANNPHAHIIIHDRDLKTGRRVALLSSKNSTRYLRKVWEEKANNALAKLGIVQGISRKRKNHQDCDPANQNTDTPNCLMA